MSERIETTAIRNLIHNEEYCRKVLPFIKEEYFVEVVVDKEEEYVDDWEVEGFKAF